MSKANEEVDILSVINFDELIGNQRMKKLICF